MNVDVFSEMDRIFKAASPLENGRPKKQAVYSEWVKLEGLLQWATEHSCGEGKRVLEHAQAVVKAYRLEAEYGNS